MSDSLSHREILSAITLALVSIRSAVTPTGLLIMRAHWRRANLRPTKDRLQPLIVHDSEDVLSAKIRTKGWGIFFKMQFP